MNKKSRSEGAAFLVFISTKYELLECDKEVQGLFH